MKRFARVSHAGKTYFAEHDAAAGEPHSALTQLIQGVWQAHPSIARLILRARIETNEEMTPLNWGMLKTAARRFVSAEWQEPVPEWVRVEFSNPYALAAGGDESPPPDPMGVALQMAAQSRRVERLYASDRPVGAVLFHRERGVLAVGHNTNASNRTLHAELNLVQSWWREQRAPLPEGAELYTTLEPCRMCSGMIHHCGPSTRVSYLESDGVAPVPWKLTTERYYYR